MFKILNNYANGYVTVPVVLACKKRGLFQVLEGQSAVPFADLVQKLGANAGHLRTALHLLESLGWVQRQDGDDYVLLAESCWREQFLDEMMELLDFPMEEYLRKSQQKYSLRQWMDRSIEHWQIDNARYAEYLDGILVIPLLLALKKQGLITDDLQRPQSTPLPGISKKAEQEILAWFVQKGWMVREKDLFQFTDIGRFILDRIFITATIFSYKPMLRNIEEVIFGDCQQIFRRDGDDHELHVDRALNVIGIDFNEKALEETTATLKDIDHIVIKGDIGNPAQVIADLAKHGIADLENILHVRSFLEHDRPYLPPTDSAASEARKHIPSQAVFVDQEGNSLDPTAVMQSLVEHLQRWSSVLNKHGLLLLEVHSLEPQTVGEFIDKCESLHFDASAAGQGRQVESQLSEVKRKEAQLEALLGCLLAGHLQTIEHRQIVERYGKWLVASREFLAKQGTTALPLEQLWQEWERQIAEWMQDPHLQAKARLLDVAVRNLPDILTGKLSAVEIMFPNGSMALVEGIYKENPVADYLNNVLVETVVAYVQEQVKADQTSRLRILELGAGTGGTSAAVLEALRPYQQHMEEYCYTDLSKAFLLHAKKKFGAKNPYLTYKIVNVEKPLDEQGIATGDYDLVIAANVLHATKRIRKSLAHCKAALKKNGWLVLNELTSASLIYHLTFGLLDGWWLYEDEEIRLSGCPGLSVESWRNALLAEGYRSVYWPAEAAKELGHQIIVSPSDGVFAAGESERLAQASHLQNESPKGHCWVPESQGGVQRTDVHETASVLHPLLQTNLSDFTKQKYGSTFSGQEFFLRDHVVQGQSMLPGVAYLEMARAAVEQAAGVLVGEGTAIVLRNIVWTRPITLEMQPVRVQIGLQPKESGNIRFVVSSEQLDGSQVVHNRGKAMLQPAAEALVYEVSALQAQCARSTLTSRQCYDLMAALGLDYGPGHRGIETLFVGEGQVLAQLSLPDAVADTHHAFVLHPTLMDAALQASIGLLAEADDQVPPKLALPYAMKEVEILGSCTKRMWAYLRYSEGSQVGDDVQKLDIDLCDEAGKVCVRMRGFESRVLEGERVPARATEAESMLLQPVWE